jgi:rod shape determining protein RodA
MRFLSELDWVSIGLTLALSFVGLSFVFSSTYTPELPFSTFFKKQLFGFITGFAIYLVVAHLQPRVVGMLGYFGYFGALLLVLATLIKGTISNGAQRWFSLGFIKFQPSELLKICYPLFLGFFIDMKGVLEREPSEAVTPSRLAFPIIMLCLGFLLTFKQPDLGTAFVVLAIGVVLLWMAGLPTWFFVLAAVLAVSATPIIWKNLRPYQQRRILAMMGHGEVSRDRYQLEQAKISVGSGGMFGKGFLKGTQNKLSFLPEDHNDFIFAVVCEELGLVGALLVLFLFALLAARLFIISAVIPNLREQIAVIGIALTLALSVLINTGMVIGLLPVVGIPLPLFSYGLTNLWVTLFGLGVANGIYAHRHGN